jgi:hypothetical protein
MADVLHEPFPGRQGYNGSAVTLYPGVNPSGSQVFRTEPTNNIIPYSGEVIRKYDTRFDDYLYLAESGFTAQG